jgi:hypothetical protein
MRVGNASTPAFSGSSRSHAKIEKRSREGAEIAAKSLSNKASRHIKGSFMRRKGLKTGLIRANQYKSTSDIVVQNVEKPVFLGSFRHIVPLPESMEQTWLPKCLSRS